MLVSNKIAIPDKKHRLPLCVMKILPRKFKRPIVLFLQNRKFCGKCCLMPNKNRMLIFCLKGRYTAHGYFLQVHVPHLIDHLTGKIRFQPAAVGRSIFCRTGFYQFFLLLERFNAIRQTPWLCISCWNIP